MMYQLQNIGPLDVIEIPGKKDSPTIVVLHGYGADAQDLAQISHVLKTPPGTRWLIPNGPLEIPLGPHISGRGWAHINVAEWQRAIAEGRPRDLTHDRPPELFDSRKLLSQMLTVANVDLKNTVFAGFSQGAMLATHMSLTSDVRPCGLAILSGSLINEDQWKTLAPKLSGLAFFQSHGLRDDVLPFQGAQKLEKLLIDSGLKGKLLSFNGGHEIPSLVMQGLQKYFVDLFPQELWEKDED